MRTEQAALPGSKSPRTEIRVDRFSLRKISFWDGSRWVEAEATMGLPDDVSVWEWVDATKELRAIHRANAKLHLSVLLKAVNDLREAGHAASARAELGTDLPPPSSTPSSRKTTSNSTSRTISRGAAGPLGTADSA